MESGWVAEEHFSAGRKATKVKNTHHGFQFVRVPVLPWLTPITIESLGAGLYLGSAWDQDGQDSLYDELLGPGHYSAATGRRLFAHAQNFYADSNTDCTIQVKFAGKLSAETPEFFVGPDKNRLGPYVSEGKLGTHGFRFEVTGRVNGVIGFVGGPDRDQEVKGHLANGGEWTVGQRSISASVYSRWADGSISPPSKSASDDSPLPYARNISANTFAWRDSPGSYNTALVNDSRLVTTSSSIVLRVYATNGEKTCGITFRINQSLRGARFSGSITRLY